MTLDASFDHQLICFQRLQFAQAAFTLPKTGLVPASEASLGFLRHHPASTKAESDGNHLSVDNLGYCGNLSHCDTSKQSP